MKRKLVDGSDWQRIIEKKYKQTYIDSEDYKGHIAIIYIDKVKEPLNVTMGNKKYSLADDGYKWVKFLPDNLNYAAIAMYDSNNSIVQWYFDIINQSGLDEEGKLFYDDVYLDVVVFPQQDIFLLDEDELEEALIKEIITKEQYDLAYKTARDLMEEIKSKNNHIINSSYKYLEYMENIEL